MCVCVCVYTGAPALGLVVTSLIDNAFEDLMVLGAASAAAYASVVNLPLRYVSVHVCVYVCVCARTLRLVHSYDACCLRRPTMF